MDAQAEGDAATLAVGAALCDAVPDKAPDAVERPELLCVAVLCAEDVMLRLVVLLTDGERLARAELLLLTLTRGENEVLVLRDALLVTDVLVLLVIEGEPVSEACVLELNTPVSETFEDLEKTSVMLVVGLMLSLEDVDVVGEALELLEGLRDVEGDVEIVAETDPERVGEGDEDRLRDALGDELLDGLVLWERL